jgi:hypothetical protein
MEHDNHIDVRKITEKRELQFLNQLYPHKIQTTIKPNTQKLKKKKQFDNDCIEFFGYV